MVVLQPSPSLPSWPSEADVLKALCFEQMRRAGPKPRHMVIGQALLGAEPTVPV